MNFESPVSFVCNNTLGEASIGHNIGSYDFNLLLNNFDKTFDLYSIFYWHNPWFLLNRSFKIYFYCQVWCYKPFPKIGAYSWRVDVEKVTT
jgi:hypothetical protein